MYMNERYQTHCVKCSKVFEADSIAEAVRKAEAHEAKKNCRDEEVVTCDSIVNERK